MTREFGGRARFVVENYGDSELARRFGVTRYPAIFVGDALVATPRDFGFYGKGEGSGDGRYTPWRDAASHERFRSDLARWIALALAGGAAPAPSGGAEVWPELRPERLPELGLADLAGAPIERAALEGRVVLVEFWATWCPPCQGTLRHLGELARRHGRDLEVLALAVESEEEGVRRMAAKLDLPLRWALGTPEIARAFGDLASVPTLFLFGRDGRLREVFHGAPPDLAERTDRAVAAALAPAGPS